MRDLIYAGIFGITVAGLSYAADQRIDERVSQAIENFQINEINRQIDFYVTKEVLSPESVTPDDRVNRKVLERQLNQLGGAQ